ncbi:MAG: DUF4058 family protein [Crocosphaera sp.]|nr:DUF4058 family protein [Crocosphaera sp.]
MNNLSPFPGMNPYLEASTFWSAFQSRLIVAIADALSPLLLPKYYIEIETRTYLSTPDDNPLVGIPDAVIFSSQKQKDLQNSSTRTLTTSQPKQVVLPIAEEIKERYLEVREIENSSVITVIEVLSPKNKAAGIGRLTYQQKRQTILRSFTHLIEIDLLRSGKPMEIMNQTNDTDYRILVSRSYQRPFADLYEFSLQDRIPDILIPLQAEEPEPVLELQQLIEGIYTRGNYHLRIDYQQPPPPPVLSLKDREWLQQLTNTNLQ